MHDLQRMIESDRKSGYRPTVRIALTQAGQVLVGRKKETWEEFVARGRRAYPWDLFQGGIEPGESLVEAFAREAREEIGSNFFFLRKSVRFLYRDQDERPVEKDGRTYCGKSYYVCTAPLISVPWFYDEGTNGSHDEYFDNPMAWSGHEYFVLLMNYVKVQIAIQSTQRAKSPALLRAVHHLRSLELVQPHGGGCSYVAAEYMREHLRKGGSIAEFT
jgi:8-oxo-dGTP pyrophosphatase MutT (NUDIX family)